MGLRRNQSCGSDGMGWNFRWGSQERSQQMWLMEIRGSKEKEPCGVWGRALPGEEGGAWCSGEARGWCPEGVQDGGGREDDRDGRKSGHGALGGLVGTWPFPWSHMGPLEGFHWGRTVMPVVLTAFLRLLWREQTWCLEVFRNECKYLNSEVILEVI